VDVDLVDVDLVAVDLVDEDMDINMDINMVDVDLDQVQQEMFFFLLAMTVAEEARVYCRHYLIYPHNLGVVDVMDE